MKILYAIPVFLDYRIPLFKQLNGLFKGDFHILYSPKRYTRRFPKVLEKLKISIPSILHEFYGDYLFNTKTMSFSKFSYEGRSIPFTVGLIRTLYKLSPDIVITEGFLGWTPYVLLYCVLFRKKMFIHYERTCHTERNTSIIITFQRKLFNRFTVGYLVNGSETLNYLLSIGISKDKIHIAGMSADPQIPKKIKLLDESEKVSIKKKYLVNSNGLIYLYVGRVSKAKGVDRLIEAWQCHIKKYPQDSLLIAGDGELLEYYQKQKIGGLHILGRVNYDDIYRLYYLANVFVIATLQDNWSLVVPEAMSCGIPIATSIFNGCHMDLIKEGVDGYTFNPFVQKEIIETLEKFHYSDLSSMSKAAIQMEKPFNIENSAIRIFNVLK